MTAPFRILILIAGLFLFTGKTFAQVGQYPFAKWDSLTIKKARTADWDSLLADEEKDVIMLMNLLRMKPQLFYDTYVLHYMDSTAMKETKFTRSLKNDLKKIKKPLRVLEYDTLMQEIAADHAYKMGKKGKTGHGNADKRFESLPRKKFAKTAMGENCQYGEPLPIEIVMSLLIDEGVEDLQHRKNFLNPRFKYVGAAIRPHRKYGSNCVIDFSD